MVSGKSQIDSAFMVIKKHVSIYLNCHAAFIFDDLPILIL